MVRSGRLSEPQPIGREASPAHSNAPVLEKAAEGHRPAGPTNSPTDTLETRASLLFDLNSRPEPSRFSPPISNLAIRFCHRQA